MDEWSKQTSRCMNNPALPPNLCPSIWEAYVSVVGASSSLGGEEISGRWIELQDVQASVG
jgi:hypothetical protein